jgi:hypothetical protein
MTTFGRSDAMEKLVEKVMEQIREIVDETIDQEVGDDLGALRMQGELYRAIANECLCEGDLIIADVPEGAWFHRAPRAKLTPPSPADRPALTHRSPLVRLLAGLVGLRSLSFTPKTVGTQFASA